MSPALRLFLAFVAGLTLTIVHNAFAFALPGGSLLSRAMLAPGLLLAPASFEALGLIVLINFFVFLLIYSLMTHWVLRRVAQK